VSANAVGGIEQSIISGAMSSMGERVVKMAA
jgi:hypothetical protein